MGLQVIAASAAVIRALVGVSALIGAFASCLIIRYPVA
jgi:hypothetical protein